MNILNEMQIEFNDIQENILNESYSRYPPKKVSRILSAILKVDAFLYSLYSQHTFWDDSLQKPTAGVAPHPNNTHIVFHYNAAWFNSLTSAQLMFLLLHEIGHILREHHARSKYQGETNGKMYHKIANIAMDTWINQDILDGKMGQFTVKAPMTGFSFKDYGEECSSVEEWVNESVEKATGTNHNYKYDGPHSTEPLYDWIVKIFDKHGLLTPPPPPEGAPPKIGDIVRGPGKVFGKIVAIDEKTKKVTKITPMTKAEAYQEVRIRDGVMKPPKK